VGSHNVIYSIFLIFAGAAVVATIALYARQSMLVAYMLLGIIIGPWGLQLASDIQVIEQISHVGIIFLLFLLGLNLEPRELLSMLRSTTIVTLLSSGLFALVGAGISLLCGLPEKDAVIVGLGCMFSSTIIGLKLLPATALHHQHMGEVMVSILLLQDIIAILVILLLQGLSSGEGWVMAGKLALALPMLVLFAFGISRYVLHRLLCRFDGIQEYIFLVTIGWCLSMAVLAEHLNLSSEIGAFIGGVSLAISPIARFIAESLRPLRDFFLIMFFFTLGAQFNFGEFQDVILPAGLIAASMLILKPLSYKYLLSRQGERPDMALQTGVRLGQISEFSLLIAVIAIQSGQLSERGSYTLQLATMLTFIVSSYWVVIKFPTPISTNDKLRMD